MLWKSYILFMNFHYIFGFVAGHYVFSFERQASRMVNMMLNMNEISVFLYDFARLIFSLVTKADSLTNYDSNDQW